MRAACHPKAISRYIMPILSVAHGSEASTGGQRMSPAAAGGMLWWQQPAAGAQQSASHAATTAWRLLHRAQGFSDTSSLEARGFSLNYLDSDQSVGDIISSIPLDYSDAGQGSLDFSPALKIASYPDGDWDSWSW